MEAKNGIKTSAANILITEGSQQGLDYSARVFLNKGDVVLLESPSYLGAINAFKACEPTFIEIPTDDNGMIMNIEIGAAAVNGIAFHPQKFPGRAKLHLCLLLNCTFFCRSLDRIEKAPYSDPFFVVV